MAGISHSRIRRGSATPYSPLITPGRGRRACRAEISHCGIRILQGVSPPRSSLRSFPTPHHILTSYSLCSTKSNTQRTRISSFPTCMHVGNDQPRSTASLPNASYRRHALRGLSPRPPPPITPPANLDGVNPGEAGGTEHRRVQPDSATLGEDVKSHHVRDSGQAIVDLKRGGGKLDPYISPRVLGLAA